jgi:hypothetical protein
MKKSTYETIYATLSTIDFESKESVMAELYKEIHKGEEAKAAKVAQYDSAKTVVLEGLRVAGTPVTIAELYEEIKGDLPEGFTKAQVQYGIRYYWCDKITKHEGKVMSYSLAEGV